MKIFFVNNNSNDNRGGGGQVMSLPSGYRFRVVRPVPWKLINLCWYVLNVFTPVRYVEHQIVDSNDRVVTAIKVIGKIYKFPFMTSRAIHIGPGYTIEEERGKGLYKLLLDKILRDYKGTQVFAIIDEHNIASIKGVTRTGFRAFARGHCNLFKKYVLDEYIL